MCEAMCVTSCVPICVVIANDHCLCNHCVTIVWPSCNHCACLYDIALCVGLTPAALLFLSYECCWSKTDELRPMYVRADSVFGVFLRRLKAVVEGASFARLAGIYEEVVRYSASLRGIRFHICIPARSATSTEGAEVFP